MCDKTKKEKNVSISPAAGDFLSGFCLVKDWSQLQ